MRQSILKEAEVFIFFRVEADHHVRLRLAKNTADQVGLAPTCAEFPWMFSVTYETNKRERFFRFTPMMWNANRKRQRNVVVLQGSKNNKGGWLGGKLPHLDIQVQACEPLQETPWIGTTLRKNNNSSFDVVFPHGVQRINKGFSDEAFEEAPKKQKKPKLLATVKESTIRLKQECLQRSIQEQLLDVIGDTLPELGVRDAKKLAMALGMAEFEQAKIER